MEDRKINNFITDLKKYSIQKKEYVETKILSSALMADTILIGGAVLNKAPAFSWHPLVGPISIAGIGSLTAIGVVAFFQERKKYKLCKEKIETYEFNDYCDDSSMMYKPNSLLNNMLDNELYYTDRNKKSDIINLAVYGSIFVLIPTLHLITHNYGPAAIWANFWLNHTTKYSSQLIANCDTKKIINRVKQTGKVLKK